MASGGTPMGAAGAVATAGSNNSVGGSAAAGGGGGGSMNGGAPATGGSAGSSSAGNSGGGGLSGGGGASGGGPNGGGSNGGGASSSCSGKTYKLCEDFENGSVGSLPTGWTSFKGYGDASPQDQTLSSDEFHSGGKALMSNSAQFGVSRIQKDISALGATASKHWGRIFYKVKSPAAKDPANYLHVTFVSLFGASENRVVDTVSMTNSNTHQWLFNNPNDQGGTASKYDWTFDAAWHCAEWFVDVGTKSYRFFSDAQEVKELAFVGQDNQMSNYKTLIVGATHYQKDTLSGPFIVWFDDLAIDDAQIGCQ